MTREEAIKKIRDWNLDNDKIEVLSVIIPELKESEDERIRKAIKLLVEMKENDSIGLEPVYGASYKDMITWLEKQGEKKPADTPKFRVGDWVINKHSFVMQIVDVQDSHYVYMYKGKELSATIEQMENSCHLWTIQDAKDGDVLEFADHGRTVIGIVSYVNKVTGKVDVNCLLEGNNFKLGNYYALDTIKPHPATEEQRDLLFQKMKEAGYEWDAKDKVLKKIEPKSTWSEEDERMFNSIVENLDNGEWFDIYQADWLKSLKVRVQPQPKHELNKGVDNEYIDLGLPSGTLWKSSNEDGYYTYDEAVEKFSDNIPTKEQWEELENKCSWEWKDNGYDVTGPNGKSIFFPTAGFRTGTCVYSDGTNGYYWSSKYVDNDNVWFMYFYDKFHSMRCDGRYYGQSVRLVK
jgi:hypothetical protein